MATSAPSRELIAVLERTGYFQEGAPGSGVLLAEDLLRDNSQVDKRARYDAVIRKDKLGAAAVYELSGSACIYFADLSDHEPEAAQLARRHQVAWNHGLAPMLWIITPTRVILYDCFSRPSSQDSDPSQHVIHAFENTIEGLAALNALAGREQVDSGAFWQHAKAKRIDRRDRVDSQLLEDLTRTVAHLSDYGLALEHAQKLVGRSIYVAYLVGRTILRPEFLQQKFGSAKFTEILLDHDRAYALFEWIEETFNGDLFPLIDIEKGVNEREVVAPRHLESVRRFLSGEDLDTGQLTLFPYSFDVIPIELLSSIYERFTHAADTTAAKERSTHYTPLNLVDLVLTQALDDSVPRAKVLDLACGSGVFLVEAFRRLVAQRARAGEAPERPLIRSVLYEQIFGVDVNPGAVQIAAFSLYLTALELDRDPEPVEDLRFERLVNRNLFVADAFDEDAPFNRVEPFASQDFQVIVGNPPWTRSALTHSAHSYCVRRGLPQARKTPDQAFLWRFGDFSKDHTRIALVMAAKPFFAVTPAARTARRDLFHRFAPKVLINLSALREAELFQTAVAPAMILVADGRPATEKSQFAYVAVERSEGFRRHGILEIPPDRVKTLAVQDAAEDESLLKTATWAGGRDLALIRKLRMSFPTLGRFEAQLGFQMGQGFQQASGARRTPKTIVQLPWLPQESFAPFRLCRIPPGLHPPQSLHRARRVEIYRAPLLVTTRMIGRRESWCGFASALTWKDIAFDEYFFGISLARASVKHPRMWAQYLNGILNSSLATYFLFLTSAVWGVERDEVRAQDIRALPLPRLEDNPSVARRVIEAASELRRSSGDGDEMTRLRRRLDLAVFDMYELAEAERILVLDFVRFTLPLQMSAGTNGRQPRNGSIAALARPSAEHLTAYARRLVATLQPLLDTLGERRFAADVFPLQSSPLQAVHMRSEPKGQTTTERKLEITVQGGPESLEGLGEELYGSLSRPLTEGVYTRRVLRAYIDDAVVIAKPAQRRYWTEAAALHDADAILAEDLRIS